MSATNSSGSRSTGRALAHQLVDDSAAKGPGKALADKAAEIEAAANAGRTDTACAEMTDCLGLVRAQTGKKLTGIVPVQLTTDANRTRLLRTLDDKLEGPTVSPTHALAPRPNASA